MVLYVFRVMGKTITFRSSTVDYKTMGVFGCHFSHPISLVFYMHVFQTAKRCVFYKKFIYESYLKIKLIHFF